jgi:hypothetical protein
MDPFTLNDLAVIHVNAPTLEGVIQEKTVDKCIMQPMNSTLHVPFILIIPGK